MSQSATASDSLTPPRWPAAIPVVLAMLTMIGPFSIDSPFPAFPDMSVRLGVPMAQLQFVVTAYLAAFAVMSLVHGPLSDAVGRRPVLLGAIGVFVLASIGCTLAPSLPVLLGFRVLQGLSAGGATIVSRTVVRDLFSGAQAQRVMSTVTMIFGLAPALAPVVGGLVLQWGTWRWVFGFQIALGLLLLALVLLMLPESHPRSARVAFRVGDLASGVLAVARRPDVLRLASAGALNFGALFLYIGGSAIFIHDLLGLGELDYWRFFVPMISMMMLGSWLNGRLADRLSLARRVGGGFVIGVVGGLVGVVIGLTPVQATWPWAVIGPSLMGLGNGFSYPMLQLMLMELVPERRGTVSSFGAFGSLLFSAIVTVAVTPWVAVSTLGMAATALAMLLLGQGVWWWYLRVDHPRVTPAPTGS